MFGGGEGEHSQRQSDLGESRVNRTLSPVRGRWGERGHRGEEPGAASKRAEGKKVSNQNA